MKLSAKEKMLAALSKKEGYNTFTVAQAQRRFGVVNVAARIAELRQDGHKIVTEAREMEDGTTKSFYRLASKRTAKSNRTFA